MPLLSAASSEAYINLIQKACESKDLKQLRKLILGLPKDQREMVAVDMQLQQACVKGGGIDCLKFVIDTYGLDLIELSSSDSDGVTCLISAIQQRNTDMVNYLLELGVDPNFADDNGRTALYWSSFSSQKQVVEMLLQAGADASIPDTFGACPLHYVTQNTEKLETAEILRLLIQHSSLSDLDIKDSEGRSPLIWAASVGSERAVDILIAAGASVATSDNAGLSAIHCAASHGFNDIIDVLVSHDSALVDVTDRFGCTPLFYAVTHNHQATVNRLLAVGANPNYQDKKGRSPAHCAAGKGHTKLLSDLEGAGANLWLKCKKGQLPVHEAFSRNKTDSAKMLLERRGSFNIDAPTASGKTLLQIATKHGNTKLTDLLMKILSKREGSAATQGGPKSAQEASDGGNYPAPDEAATRQVGNTLGSETMTRQERSQTPATVSVSQGVPDTGLSRTPADVSSSHTVPEKKMSQIPDAVPDNHKAPEQKPAQTPATVSASQETPEKGISQISADASSSHTAPEKRSPQVSDAFSDSHRVKKQKPSQTSASVSSSQAVPEQKQSQTSAAISDPEEVPEQGQSLTSTAGQSSQETLEKGPSQTSDVVSDSPEVQTEVQASASRSDGQKIPDQRLPQISVQPPQDVVDGGSEKSSDSNLSDEQKKLLVKNEDSSDAEVCTENDVPDSDIEQTSDGSVRQKISDEKVEIAEGKDEQQNGGELNEPREDDSKPALIISHDSKSIELATVRVSTARPRVAQIQHSRPQTSVSSHLRRPKTSSSRLGSRSSGQYIQEKVRSSVAEYEYIRKVARDLHDMYMGYTRPKSAQTLSTSDSRSSSGESLEASSQTTTSEKSVYSAVFTRGGMKKIAQHLSQNQSQREMFITRSARGNTFTPRFDGGLRPRTSLKLRLPKTPQIKE